MPWSDRQLSLKGRAEMAQVFIAPIITYYLTAVPCPDSWLNKLAWLLFCLLWKQKKLLVKHSVCCQEPLKDGLGILWLMMCRHELKLKHLWLYIYSDQVWNPLAEELFPQLASLKKFKSEYIKRPYMTEWQMECHKVLMPIHRKSKTSSRNTTKVFYRRLVEPKK